MWTIIKKEGLEIVRDKVSSILLISLCLLLFLSLMISWSYNNWYSQLQKEVTENARHHWETQTDKNSHSAAHFGIYLFKPLSPYALWDNGVDKHVGVSVFIEAHIRNQLQFKAVEDNPLLARWGELTPAYVLLYLMPLLIMWLASNSIVKERSEGTLKLVLSQGMTLSRYVWGKAMTLWLLSAILIFTLWIIGGMLMSMARGESFFTLNGLLLLLVYLVFAGIFIHGSLFVSLLAKTQRNALVALIGIWLVTIWIIPRLATQISERAYPSPVTETFLQNISDDIAINGINGHGGENEKMIELKEIWTKKYGVDSVQQLPLNFLGVILQADEDTNNLIYDRHYKQLYELYEKQAEIHQFTSFLSPVMPARQASMAFSGTDFSSTIHFSESVDAYRKEFIEILNNRLRDKSRYSERDTGTVAFWKTLPVYQYKPLSTAEKWHKGNAGLGIIFIWLLVCMALMQIAIRFIPVL